MRRFAFAATFALVCALMPLAAKAENAGSDHGIQVDNLVYRTNVSHNPTDRAVYQEVRWGGRGVGVGYGWGGPRVSVYVGRPYYGGYYPYSSYYGSGSYPYYSGYGSYYPYSSGYPYPSAYGGYPYPSAYGGYSTYYWPGW
jgi:hypothetical protein